jgi:hypothetical protein
MRETIHTYNPERGRLQDESIDDPVRFSISSVQRSTQRGPERSAEILVDRALHLCLHDVLRPRSQRGRLLSQEHQRRLVQCAVAIHVFGPEVVVVHGHCYTVLYSQGPAGGVSLRFQNRNVSIARTLAHSCASGEPVAPFDHLARLRQLRLRPRRWPRRRPSSPGPAPGNEAPMLGRAGGYARARAVPVRPAVATPRRRPPAPALRPRLRERSVGPVGVHDGVRDQHDPSALDLPDVEARPRRPSTRRLRHPHRRRSPGAGGASSPGSEHASMSLPARALAWCGTRKVAPTSVGDVGSLVLPDRKLEPPGARPYCGLP